MSEGSCDADCYNTTPICTGLLLHYTHPLRLIAVAMEAQVRCIYLTVLPYLLRPPASFTSLRSACTMHCMYKSRQNLQYLCIQVVGAMAATPSCTFHCSVGGPEKGANVIDIYWA